MSRKPDLTAVWRLIADARTRASDDLNAGSVLRELLEPLEAEMEQLEKQLDALWDDVFVETAEDWAAPYLGPLVAVGAGIAAVAVAAYLCRGSRAK